MVGFYDLMACIKSSGGSNPPEREVPMARNHDVERLAPRIFARFHVLMSSRIVKAALLSLSVWCAHPQFYALSLPALICYVLWTDNVIA
jgi:hypothetical protein